MKYNFDSIIDRKHTNSLKWDLFDDEYPMWVADMDFYAAPLIYESVNRRFLIHISIGGKNMALI